MSEALQRGDALLDVSERGGSTHEGNVSASLLKEVFGEETNHLFVISDYCAALVKLLANNNGGQRIFVEFLWARVAVSRIDNDDAVDAALCPPLLIGPKFFLHRV